MAGQKNDKQIIIGAASVFVGTKNQDGVLADTLVLRPTFIAGPATPQLQATSGVGLNWRDVGYTQEGVELSVEPDFGEVEVDQLLDTPRMFKQSMRVTVNTTLAEATLENLLVVWGQAVPSGAVDDIDILAGELNEVPLERSLIFVGPAPSTPVGARQERVYWAARAVQTESTSIAMRRSENTGLPASFRLLPLGIQSGNDKVRYGRILDRATA